MKPFESKALEGARNEAARLSQPLIDALTTPPAEPPLPDPCLAKREPNEPMFVLLARDSCAPATLEFWCQARQAQIATGVRPDTEGERAHIAEITARAAEFRAWRAAHRRPQSEPPDQIATLTAQLAEARGLLDRHIKFSNKLFRASSLHQDTVDFLSTPAPAGTGGQLRVPVPNLSLTDVEAQLKWRWELDLNEPLLFLRDEELGVAYVEYENGYFYAQMWDEDNRRGPFETYQQAQRSVISAFDFNQQKYRSPTGIDA